MGKHAKTYSTQAAYEADMENWEYPHLSLIISGGTVVYNTSEQEPEPGELEGALILFNEAPAELMDTVNGIFMVQIEYGHYTDGDWVGDYEYMPTSEYTITSSSCILDGEEAIFDVGDHGSAYECEILGDGTTGHVDFTIAGDGWSYDYSLPVDLS